jgi:[glutamine synthetase] adenylyltransferase / [glutamine synthetase]-adenylyl-L-tyrosine phosphorylase
MNVELERIREASGYLTALLRRPAYLDWLWEQKNLYRRYALTTLYQEAQALAQRAQSFDELLRTFRTFKQRHFLRIGGRDLLGWADLAETTAQLSDLACVALQVGLETLHGNPGWWVSAADSAAFATVREQSRLTVLGLGKLGGYELNYVSDVDLLFLFSPAEPSREELPEAQPVLNRLCQWLSRLLADSLDGDRVFLVDLRLRPQGKDGKLVPSIAAATDHYLLHGRPWERQMLLKARPVAGDRSLGMAFLKEVRPFVFRRFLDFQALTELHAMRDRILQEAVRPRSGWRQFDVKLGIGGIREIEFLVQSFQLIYGGRHPQLDEPNTVRCLERLQSLELLPPEVVAQLQEAYTFLRRVEHWVQLDQNRQTQELPQSAEGRAKLARALGFDGGEESFLEKLRDYCTTVHGHFLELFEGTEAKSSAVRADLADAPPTVCVEKLWTTVQQQFASEHTERLRGCLEHYPQPVQRVVLGVLQRYASLPAGSFKLVERVPLRLERYFSQARRRPGLMKLFNTPKDWLTDLCQGLAQSELVADLLSHQPSLAEGVATAAAGCLRAEVWQQASEHILASIGDYETAFEWIRRLKNERLLQLTLADLAGAITQVELETSLSSLGEFVIRHTYHRIREERGLSAHLPLAVLALGKLGSREMNYLSDLDLVFVYDAPEAEDSGQIPMEVVRFIQRLMRMLSTPLQEGPGYAVDTRLRPTGNYGPLVVTRQTWWEYYRHQADLWELQALLRVRAIAGQDALCQWLDGEARKLCYRERDPQAVWSRLCHLRQRMQQERSEESDDKIDLKLGLGGLADIEFLVQGHQLLYGHSRPELQTGSIRLALEALKNESAAAAGPFREVLATFCELRALEHRLQLSSNLTGSTVTELQLSTMQALGLWPPRRAANTIDRWQDLLRLRRRVRQLFSRWCTNL